MTLHINKPEYSEERKNSQPLSFEEQNEAVEILNERLPIYNPIFSKDQTKIQNLLYHYENLQAFFDYAGGWDGVNRLRDKANAYDELIKQKKP